jgi:hypothetical protein
VLFAVSSLAAGLAPGTPALIVARGFQGAGAAAMFATTIALRDQRVADAAGVARRLVGGLAHAIVAQAPPGRRDALDTAIHSAFASGLNTAMVVAGAVGIAGALLVALAVRPEREPVGERAPAT